MKDLVTIINAFKRFGFAMEKTIAETVRTRFHAVRTKTIKMKAYKNTEA